MQNAAVPLHLNRRRCAGCTFRPSCLAADLKGDDLKRLEAIVRTPAPLAEGEYLYLAGSAPRYIYFVSRGSLVSHCHQADGEEQIVGLYLPGDPVGLDSLGSTRYTHSVRAAEKTNVCAIALEDITRMDGTTAGLAGRLMKLISEQVRVGQRNHVLMSRRSAVERVARFLADYASRLDRRGLVSDEFVLGLSRKDLANYLGLKIETVSRCFSALRDQDVLNARRRVIAIKDADALNHLACGEPAQAAAQVA